MRVLLTGGRGMLGRALVESLRARGDVELTLATRQEVDLRDARATRDLLAAVRPDTVLHAAAKVGGIAANIADPTGFLLENLQLDTSLLSASLEAGVRDLLYVGSSCMYPRDYRQPLVETDVLAAPLEPTNEGYALAKISSSRLCSYASEQFGVHYRTIIPSNLYGPYDDFSAGKAHLVAAALAKTERAKAAGDEYVDVWGDGTARREFTYVGDLASWISQALGSFDILPPLLNVGSGEDRTVREYYERAAEIVGFTGALRFDATKPTGMKQKLMDSTLARGFGWDPRTSLTEGMTITYEHYKRTLGA